MKTQSLTAVALISSLVAFQFACTSAVDDNVDDSVPGHAKNVEEFFASSNEAVDVHLMEYVPTEGAKEGYAMLSGLVRSGEIFNQIDFRIPNRVFAERPELLRSLQAGNSQELRLDPHQLLFAARPALDAPEGSDPIRPVLVDEVIDILRGRKTVEPFCGAQVVEGQDGRIRLAGEKTELPAVIRFRTPRVTQERLAAHGELAPEDFSIPSGQKSDLRASGGCAWTEITMTWACRHFGLGSTWATEGTCKSDVCSEELTCTITGVLTAEQLKKLGCEIKKDSGTPPTWSCSGGWEYKEGTTVTQRIGTVAGACTAVKYGNNGGMFNDLPVYVCECAVSKEEKTNFINRCKSWQDAAANPTAPGK